MILTSPWAAVAVEIDGVLRKKMIGAAAQMWMLAGNEAFGGLSPIQLIKAGRGNEVKAKAERMSKPIEDNEHDQTS